MKVLRQKTVMVVMVSVICKTFFHDMCSAAIKTQVQMPYGWKFLTELIFEDPMTLSRIKILNL